MIRQALALSLLLSASAPAFANQHCQCSKACMTQCQKGHPQGCKCKSCDCSKSGQCSEGKCNSDEHKEQIEKK